MHTVCVATKSGEDVMQDSPYASIVTGRMDESMMRHFLGDYIGCEDNLLVIDATHPYAQMVTCNIKAVCEEMQVEYIRVIRRGPDTDDIGRSIIYSDMRECAEGLKNTRGNILVTTGSKELAILCEDEDVCSRVYARVLPNSASIELCRAAGVDEKHIIAMYGPHTEDMNRAIMRQFDIKHLVTKESGSTGGYEEKINAAIAEGAQIHIIARPVEQNGISVEECKERLRKTYADIGTLLHITLAGIGMGSAEYITVAAKQAIDGADVIIGAKRMIEPYTHTHIVFDSYKPEEIIDYLENRVANQVKARGNNKGECNVCILFSGDTGIYSGATKLYEQLREWNGCADIKILPGISSFSAFAAQLGVEYTDAYLKSLHGKISQPEVRREITELIGNGKTVYILMSSRDELGELLELIPENKKDVVGIDVGINISYRNQIIIRTDYNRLMQDTGKCERGLYIVRIYEGV